MSLICFVITMVLWVSLFLYMRQRISLLEEKVAILSKLTTTVAGITKTLSESDKEVESDESEEEPEPEAEPEEAEAQNIPVHLTMNEFPRFKDMEVFKCVMIDNSGLINLVSQEMNAVEIEELTDLPVVEKEVPTPMVYELQESDSPMKFEVDFSDAPVDADLPKRVVSVDDVKTLSVNVNYEALSVKELKDKVAELNGPKLKTKKELLEFLKNKM